MQILQPLAWAPPKGYSNGIAANGRLIFVAGQVGTDAQMRLGASGFLEQARRAAALEQQSRESRITRMAPLNRRTGRYSRNPRHSAAISRQNRSLFTLCSRSRSRHA